MLTGHMPAGLHGKERTPARAVTFDLNGQK